MNTRPNILFLFSDQHRGDWMPYSREELERQGVPDLKLHMPSIQEMMEKGTVFTQALSPAPVCAPARACLASGKRYKNCRVATNQVNYDCSLPTFYTMLRESGYFVGGVGKFDLNKADLVWYSGGDGLMGSLGFTDAWDSEGKMDAIWAAMKDIPGPYGKMLRVKGWLEAHVADMSERGCRAHPTELPDALYADNWITEQGLELLRTIPEDIPWFLQVNFSGPHDPWDITKSMKERMEHREFPAAVDCSFREENLEVRKNYGAMLENIDRNIGLFLQALQASGQMENTLVVYASDHGDMMGDHSLYGKTKPQQGSIHIPLVVYAPWKQGSGYHASPVELQDLAATFLDYAGLKVPETMEAFSLRPIAEGIQTRVREYGISELVNPNRNGLFRSFGTITDGTYKLIMLSDGTEHLYCIPEDPFETRDLINALPEKAAELRKAFGQRGTPINPVAAKYAKAFSICT